MEIDIHEIRILLKEEANSIAYTKSMNYVMFLRGINVGNIRMSMAALRECLNTLELQDVKTYLQTGNVSFSSPLSSAQLKTKIEKALQNRFQYEAYVMLFPAVTIQDTIAHYPFERTDNDHRYAVFCSSKEVVSELMSYKKELDSTIEDITEGLSVIYWRAPKGKSTDTTFSKILAKSKYKATTTNRNINTLEKIAGAVK